MFEHLRIVVLFPGPPRERAPCVLHILLLCAQKHLRRKVYVPHQHLERPVLLKHPSSSVRYKRTHTHKIILIDACASRVHSYFILSPNIHSTPTPRPNTHTTQAWKGDGKGGTDIGFGASVYPAAYVLAEYLERHPYLVRGKRVIELGL